MLNYIRADYKRILTRVPRVIFLILFEIVFAGYVIHSWSKAAGNFTSVSLMNSASTFFAIWFNYTICLVDFVQGFNYDFRAKTIQVALGLGVSRLKVIMAKLIQLSLVMLTDLAVTFVVLGGLSVFTGIYLNPQQFGYLLLNGLNCVVLVACSAGLLMPLIFRTQSMVLALIGFFILVPGFHTTAVRLAVRLAPEFVQRMQPDQYFHDSCINLTFTNAIQGAFQLWPLIGTIAWFAIGIYLTWLAFRKMELDF